MRLIDADALSDWMKDYGQKCIKGERKISLMYVWKHIQDMQTIEERGTGKWIEYIPEHGKCQYCGNQVDLIDGRKHSYCGECGARMEGK